MQKKTHEIKRKKKSKGKNRKGNLSMNLQDPFINGRSILLQRAMKRNQKKTKNN
jgi:hypothetical protein